jgi:hypothetical protein
LLVISIRFIHLGVSHNACDSVIRLPPLRMCRTSCRSVTLELNSLYINFCHLINCGLGGMPFGAKPMHSEFCSAILLNAYMFWRRFNQVLLGKQIVRIQFFQDITLRHGANGSRCFGETYCTHLEGSINLPKPTDS